MTTPMMQQYREAKERHPGTLLFFRNGDFYELFEEDAEVGARLLGIQLTRRDKTIPMAGVPHHALDRYLGRLLQAGHRVAICEQMEDPATVKGRPVRREVVRVVTPGTLTEDSFLDPRRPNHLAAVCGRWAKAYCLVLRPTTGRLSDAWNFLAKACSSSLHCCMPTASMFAWIVSPTARRASCGHAAASSSIS